MKRQPHAPAPKNPRFMDFAPDFEESPKMEKTGQTPDSGLQEDEICEWAGCVEKGVNHVTYQKPDNLTFGHRSVCPKHFTTFLFNQDHGVWKNHPEERGSASEEPSPEGHHDPTECDWEGCDKKYKTHVTYRNEDNREFAFRAVCAQHLRVYLDSSNHGVWKHPPIK